MVKVNIKNAIVFGIILVVFSACNSVKNLTDFQKSKRFSDTLTVAKPFIPKIQPGDLLSINVSSASAEASSFFNPYNGFTNGGGTQGVSTSVGVNQTPAYLVDPAGNIQYPYIGNVKVAGLTTTQIRDTVKAKLSLYLKEPIVIVRYLNFKITFLGEIGRVDGMLDPYFQRAKERWLKAIRNWVYWKLVESKVVNDADGVLFTCQTELLLARETFRPYHPKKEYNAGYGIQDPPKFTSQMAEAFFKQCPDVQGKPFLLFLSRIHPKKGIGMLLTSYIRLYETLNTPDSEIPKLVIAGPGWESIYGKKLKEQLAEASPGAKSAIFPVNMLTNDAKWGAFYKCEAFVLPSHQENFGIALVEALACGKPGLISNQVNIWVEVAAEGGGIVENDSETGTYNMLKKWLEMTPAEKAQMSAAAKRVYLKYFTVDQIVQNYLSAFADHE